MAVTWRGFSDLVGSQVVAVVSNAKALVDTSEGSVTLAWVHGVAGVGLWLQAEVTKAIALARAATSNGLDLDSFYADFKFTRLGNVPASGILQYSRFTTNVQAIIPVGTIATTGPGGLQFQVTTDTSNSAYNASVGGYLIPIGQASVNVSAKSISTGSVGNVLAGTIVSFGQAIPYVDTVTNPSNFSGGIDTETDNQFRTRFPFFLAGLQGADQSAIISAILNTQAGIRYVLFENVDYPTFASDPGNFFAVIDDGSGTPSAALIAQVGLNINAVRAYGTRYQAVAPTLIVCNIVMQVETATNYVHGQVTQVVSANISAFLNNAPLNMGKLSLAKLTDIAMQTPGVTNVVKDSVTINGVESDLIMTGIQRPISGTVTVS